MYNNGRGVCAPHFPLPLVSAHEWRWEVGRMPLVERLADHSLFCGKLILPNTRGEALHTNHNTMSLNTITLILAIVCMVVWLVKSFR